ncbi:MAG: DNA replication/repair protein RecF [Sporomusaceae bacterium]|nr:DNA replication/repair protein RecF [Sporomusaceae bacterium]
MRIERLILTAYRNYSHVELIFPENINLLIGKNAQGKTNLLESLYLAILGRSYRTAHDEELIQFDQSQSLVKIIFSTEQTDHEVTFRYTRHKKKEIFLNLTPIKQNELVGLFHAVLFSPDDLLLLKGSPALRRRFIDIEFSQTNSSYYKLLIKYNRLLQQRNNLLKEIRERKATENLLPPWDLQLAEVGSYIVNRRLNSMKKLAMLSHLMHRKLTGNLETLTVKYVLHGFEGNEIPVERAEIKDWLSYCLEQNRQKDIWRGSTSVGPHRDDLDFFIDQIDAKTYASQGQQRTAILALKLAEIEYIKSETGGYPLLLLDDVMSELDMSRRAYLLDFIKDRIQTFITATDDRDFPENYGGKVYRVNQGAIAWKE